MFYLYEQVSKLLESMHWSSNILKAIFIIFCRCSEEGGPPGPCHVRRRGGSCQTQAPQHQALWCSYWTDTKHCSTKLNMSGTHPKQCSTWILMKHIQNLQYVNSSCIRPNIDPPCSTWATMKTSKAVLNRVRHGPSLNTSKAVRYRVQHDQNSLLNFT